MKRLSVALALLFLMTLARPALATVQDVNVVPPPPPASPTGVVISAVTDTAAQVSWPAVTSASQYTLYLNGQVYAGSNKPSAALSGLTPHTNYSVYVIANNTGGDSPQSSAVNFTTLSPVPIAPNAPTVSTTGTTAKLLWQPLPSSYNVTDYTLYLDGKIAATVTPTAGMQTDTLKNLAAGQHTVAVSATNDNREGPQSQPVTFTISTVPAPTGLQAYNKSADAVWVAWQPVPNAQSYNVLLNGQVVGNTYQTSYEVQGLTADTSYQIAVTTVATDGEQSLPSKISVQTESPAQPLTVANIESNVFGHMPDVQIYIVLLFAVVAALKMAKMLKQSVRR
ncbi:exochitinase 1 precursor [Peptococcaceae bacterium CEB3]|nr:exochitinase 1 precursor [Peptococcaceae bacterium CEB3]